MEPWLEHFARAGFLRSTDTAHDLKTPLNVAVLNLELLRMRVRKLDGGEDDEKLMAYARSIETELRRMARIFDTYFVLSTPPKSEGAPGRVDLAPICDEVARDAGYEIAVAAAANAAVHEARIRQGFQMFFEGASNVLAAEGRSATAAANGSGFEVTVTGAPAAPDLELTKIFKFYYTDAAGNPDLSLAAARLIAETYGGELNAMQESDKVSLRLSVPLGEK
ncbi:MAG TPA: histidine kinase dimerization/phospho-acceptor domain-containing protein [Thermoanaerobaculia bacterium]|nr:histidine kinase dimerization/phospho-acceptor domain-containing protein [Thermoanaerobaculia bacterium]